MPVDPWFFPLSIVVLDFLMFVRHVILERLSHHLLIISRCVGKRRKALAWRPALAAMSPGSEKV